MSRAQATGRTPRVGDPVVIRGTRVIGAVTRIEGDGADGRVTVKVTAVLGKPYTSRAARVWRGAWIRCLPAQVAPLPPSST
jgi:hypothetical protein